MLISSIEYALPEDVVSNDALAQEHPKWDMSNVMKRSGVSNRHIAKAHETALDLAYTACEKLLSKHEKLKANIDGLIFCTQTPDYILPPNACVLHKHLGLADNVLAFDFNLACSGYVYGLAIARGLLMSGAAKNILLINGDTYSKYIHKQDRSSRVLFGDGAAVTWLKASQSSSVIDIECSTAGTFFEKFIIPSGGCRNPRSEAASEDTIDASGNIRNQENICMDGMGILSFVNTKVPKQIKMILERNEMEIKDIDLFVFHQASKLVLDNLSGLLRIDSEKMVSNLRDIGNTVSASIPIAIKETQENGRIVEGDKVLICGFGVGLSWGSAILQF